MQSILRKESNDYSEEAESACDVKISEILLDLHQVKEDEEYQDTDEYELKFEIEENHLLKSEIESRAKSQKKYRMHTPEIKRLCVEVVIFKKS
jgi:D-mannonate dehydratase